MDTLMKRCTKCGEEFPATTEYFHRHKGRKDGLCDICKACNCAHVRNWGAENKDRRSQRARDYRAANLDHLRAQKREYERAHKEEARERFNRWKAANPGRYQGYQREYKQMTKVARRPLRRAEQSIRRARIRGNGGTHTAADIQLLYKTQRGCCWWCGNPVGDHFHVDHRIPIAKGGTSNPDNLCIACETCNISKSDKLPHEWNGRLL